MIDLFAWPVKEDYMAVKQVSKEEATKDGRRWIFYNYLQQITYSELRRQMVCWGF